ncbi:MAG: hypothetical protein JWL85_764 [Candidatus Saccharibacteria bacterium]|nr:hypothetical protein [Candidatus Saccharibacteria bacterium]
MPVTAEVTYVASLTEGRGNIESPIKDQETLDEWNEAVQACVERVTKKNTACCGDGRCALCTAATAIENSSFLSGDQIDEDMELSYQIFGGHYTGATYAAVLADLAIVRDDARFQDAFNTMAGQLESMGDEDSGHTTNLSFDNPDKTECGFEEGFAIALANTVEDEQLLGFVLDTVAALNGAASFDTFSEQDKQYLGQIVATAKARLNQKTYFNHDAVAHRDSLKQKYGGKNLSILKSAHDARHGHYEGMLAVVRNLEKTVNQQKLARQGKQAFVYHQAFAYRTADKLTGSVQENRKMELAYDFESVVIGMKLFARGMPVSIVE